MSIAGKKPGLLSKFTLNHLIIKANFCNNLNSDGKEKSNKFKAHKF